MSYAAQSHSRKNLLTGEWVLVSPHRTERPWQGQEEVVDDQPLPVHDSECYLCPGSARANDQRNPAYKGSFVFDNDFPALQESSHVESNDQPLFVARSETGCCRVVCYTDRHDLRLATMEVPDVAAALSVMFREFEILDATDDIGYVQIFENRGTMMGCSNLHPHAQIWATENVPTEPAKEGQTQREYFEKNGRPLLIDYLQSELDADERIVTANEYFAAMVPWWATWPYEILILPREQAATPADLSSVAVTALAQVLKQVLNAYDRLFGTATPYSMGFHPSPSNTEDSSGWTFHAHLYPPLLRSATVRKHMVGFEMLAMPQRDLTPEAAAARLKDNLD